jgi:hypothetical protein
MPAFYQIQIMKQVTVCKILGEQKFKIFIESRRQLIAEIDRQSIINDHRFKLRQIIKDLDLAFKDDEYILFCYENAGRHHLLKLVQDGILLCDKSKAPYTYYRTPECKVNPRVGPEMNYDYLFKQKAPIIREECERTIKTSTEGTQFVISDFLQHLDLPYQEVPTLKRKYLGLMTNIFRKLRTSGYLTITKTTRSHAVFKRTRLSV